MLEALVECFDDCGSLVFGKREGDLEELLRRGHIRSVGDPTGAVHTARGRPRSHDLRSPGEGGARPAPSPGVEQANHGEATRSVVSPSTARYGRMAS
jgi:hypothetical protein